MLAIRLTARTLWLQTLVAMAYLIPICTLDTLTGSTVVDGSIGVLLGLYLAAQPACNTIDALFANRFALQTIWSTWFGRGWLALNGLVLLLGWGVIWLGMVNLINA
jgi:hypothetical protein